MKILLRVEYCGAPFHGWQQQPGLLTVQGELERALAIYINGEAKKLGLDSPATITVTGSGRTDAGVRAADQAVSFDWPKDLAFQPEKLTHAINGISIPELNVLSAEIVSDTFDARLNPHVKTYTYTLLLQRNHSGLYADSAWCVHDKLNIAAMIQAAKLIVGQHDFSSFRAQDCTAKSTVRTILSSEITRIDRYQLVYSVQGKGFLKQMVRILVGTLVDIGREKHPPEYMAWLLTQQNRALAGQTAPAHGLLMQAVKY